jgi:nicotinamide mononucleotide transporter
MDMIINYFINYFSGMLGTLELVGSVLLIINVTLLAQQKLINYWFGLAGVLIFGLFFKEINLYSDMLLQWAFYAPLQIVGWYMWKYGKTLGDVAADGLDSMKIVTIGWQPRFIVVALIVGSALILGFAMANYTDADFPYLDALTTTMSIGASILLLKKIWENWLIWIAMDLIAIPLYYAKEAYVTSGLYVIFLGLATYGLVKWSRNMKTQKTQNA